MRWTALALAFMISSAQGDYTFTVIHEMLPGDGTSDVDQSNLPLELQADGTLLRNGVKIGTVGKLRIWNPGTPVAVIVAPGKTDGKWWQLTSQGTWVVINPATAPLGLLQ